MAGESLEYVLWVKTLPCRLRYHGCEGPIQAHHAGPRGLGQKAHDNTCIPLCMRHHTEWHSASGPFKTWRKAIRRDWARKQIEVIQSAWIRHRGSLP